MRPPVAIRRNVDVTIIPAIHAVVGGKWTPWQMQWAELRAQEELDGAGVTDGSVSSTIGVEGNLWGLGGRAWSVAGELHFTWEHTNLRLGVEYGHYTVPVANVVVPRRGYLPVFDIYWRI